MIGILGLWVFIAPFLTLTPLTYAWSHWIVGAVAGVLGFTLMRTHPAEGGITGIAGVWLFIAGFIPALLFGAGLLWNNLIVGAILAVFGFAAASRRRTGAATSTRTRGGGTPGNPLA